MKKIYKLKSDVWINENCFIDKDGDYWETQEDFTKWDTDTNNNEHYVVRYILANDIIDGVYQITDDWGVDIDWGVDYELTRQNNPEYFL